MPLAPARAVVYNGAVPTAGRKEVRRMEEQTVTVTIRTYGEKCEMTDDEKIGRAHV